MNLFAQLQAVARAPKNQQTKNTGDPVKRKKTWTKNRYLKWRNIFKKAGFKAGTNAIAGVCEFASRNSVPMALNKLVVLGWVARVGTIPHPVNGRDQIVWQWVGDEELDRECE